MKFMLKIEKKPDLASPDPVSKKKIQNDEFQY